MLKIRSREWEHVVAINGSERDGLPWPTIGLYGA